MSERAGAKRPLWFDITLLVLAAALLTTLVGLGNWQMHRLVWKTDLIGAVKDRAFNTPVDPPSGPISADDHAYLRVVVEGVYRQNLSRRVKAVTKIGPGYWLMAPLRTNRGFVWVNRGFVPIGTTTTDVKEPAGMVRVEGLLRITEPGGTFLESNAPRAGRWYSRDVHALSTHAGLGQTAAYFIDSDHVGRPSDWPRGGLTILNFRNAHLVYALTWYAMAILFFAGVVYAVYERMKGHADSDS